MLKSNFGYMAFIAINIDKEHYAIMMQTLTHNDANCWSLNNPKVAVSSMPNLYEHMTTAKAQKFNLYSFCALQIIKTAKWLMSPAQWGDISHLFFALKPILIICQQLSNSVL